ncbi:MurR/RpiR family transcriptional regulator [Vagococcus zengguangii]|uniref:MurR/RpiR family transcriptional regulator n=1 Tax=Vagococcus zengguangii TaxID=2571750 RepID=A0A4D7CN66_9ENTE|nr:MurR/RpiR family transcriptional regulator [Vagococcus zengguangii]QCI85549.1 MurR/RpiR family transcriptional regulator [Vagococcus zengguangii]TLG79402.1 MurR/RpiR family transcriptional regulator [Vagococcus zengguangii]
MEPNISIPLKIKTLYTYLSPTEKRIADYIIENPSTISHSSISDISAELEIADSTLFQFTKKLGYNGFKEFKLDLLIQQNEFTNIDIHQNICEEDSPLIMAQKVFDSNSQTLAQTKKLLKEDDLVAAVELIQNSKRLYLFGIGGSEIVATDAYHKFLRSPKTVIHSTDYHIQLMEASLLNEHDCVICISHSGNSKETVNLAEISKKAGAKVIVLTSHATSPLAKLGDIVFLSISEETEFRSEALASRISQLVIMDSLYVILMFLNKEQSHLSLAKIRDNILENKK